MSELQSLIEGARNFRELGGYPTKDGRTIRRGMLFRGGHPGELTETGVAAFRQLNLRAIVDLRTTEERAHLPYPGALLEDVQYWARDYNLSRGDIVAMLRDPETSPETMRRRTLESYRQLHIEQREGIAALFGFLAAGKAPALVNCTVGKDRTGVTSAMLLAALGVPDDIVIEDYARTELYHDPGAPIFNVDPAGPFAYLLEIDPTVWRTMMRSSPEYIAATLAQVTSEYGSAEGYVRNAIGVTQAELENIKALLLV